MIGVALVWLTTMAAYYMLGLYQFRRILNPFRDFHKLILGFAAGIIIFLALAFGLKISDSFSRVWLTLFAISGSVSIVLVRLVGFYVITRMAGAGLLRRHVVIVGTGPQAERILLRLREEQPKLHVIAGVFDDDAAVRQEHVAGHPVLGGLDDLEKFTRLNRVDEIVIAMPWSEDERVIRVVERVRQLPPSVHLGTDLVGFHFPVLASPNHFSGAPILEVVKAPMSGWKSVLKWLEDKILAALLLLLFSPVMALIALAIRLEGPGPILFRQKRYGYNNQVFEILKFRSMGLQQATESATDQATRGDPRFTRVGRVIRRTSLDELPQLFNVLGGSMSLVGPRPHPVGMNEEYAALIHGYFARHRVRPGITGWAQINGLRGETDTLEKMAQRIRYDTDYVENWSIAFDLQILVTTVFVGFFHENAY